MQRTPCVLAAIGASAVAFTAHAQDTLDARARDAVDFFGAVCVPMILGTPGPPDDDRFHIVQLDAEAAQSLVPALGNQPLWSVDAPASGTRMLHYLTSRGICAVEVEKADRLQIENMFTDLVRHAEALAGVEDIPPQVDMEDGGSKDMIWSLGNADKAFDIAISINPPSDQLVQHMMYMQRRSAVGLPASDQSSTGN